MIGGHHHDRDRLNETSNDGEYHQEPEPAKVLASADGEQPRRYRRHQPAVGEEAEEQDSARDDDEDPEVVTVDVLEGVGQGATFRGNVNPS